MLLLKTFKDAKFVVDGNAFQTFITLSTKNLCLMLTVHLGTRFKQFILMTASVSGYPGPRKTSVDIDRNAKFQIHGKAWN